MTTQIQTGRFLSNKEVLRKRAQKDEERKKTLEELLPKIEEIWEEFTKARDIVNGKVQFHDVKSVGVFYLQGDFTGVDGKIISVVEPPQLVFTLYPDMAHLIEDEVETPGGFYGRFPWSIFGMGHPKDLARCLANELKVSVTLFERTMYLGHQCSQWYNEREIYTAKPQQLVES